jgi:vacuolar-type H+-ATPase subunit I/STV1
MNIIEKIEAIKKVLFATDMPPAPPTEPTPPAEPTKYTTTDGSTVLTATSLEVGSDIMIGEIAAPDASYVLDNGKTIVVIGGKITEISDTASEPTTENVEELKQQVAQMAAQLKTIETKFAAQLEANKTELATQKQTNKDLLEVVEFMGSQSKQAPVEPPKKFEDMTAIEKFKAARKTALSN